MKLTSVTVSAENGESARAEGARKLGVGPEDVSVAPAGESQYSVSLKNASGCVEVAVSEDGLEARLTQLMPPAGGGTAATIEDVLDALDEQGVVLGIDEPAIARLVGHVAATGEVQTDVVVARGTPPEDGIDTRVEFRFSLNGKNPLELDAERQGRRIDETLVGKCFVRGGDVLAIRTPGQAPLSGQGVRGETIPAKDSRDMDLEPGPGVALHADGLTYAAAEGVVGYANFFDGLVSVEDPIEISGDGMAVRACVHPPVNNAGLTRAEVEAILEGRGITSGIDWQAIEDGLKRAADSGTPVHDLVIAQGSRPQRGEDAHISFTFAARKAAGTLIEGADRIDFKERGTLQVVKRGDVLAEKTPATEGLPGVDVFGHVLAAEAGKDRKLSISGKVEESEDGTRFVASGDGVVTLVGDSKLGVCQQYEIPGDVDYGTGNLKMDGSLKIQGWVRSGFTVRATGDIMVGKGIEDAVVEAGANLEVRGGILGDAESHVRAAGDVSAHFLENARVRAGGDIVVRDSIMHSQVWARGRMDVTGGHGCIIGGEAFAVRGVVANELGSEAMVKTRVCVGIEDVIRKRLAACEREVALFERNKVKVVRSLAMLAKRAKRSGALAGSEKLKAAKLVKWQREGALKQAKLNEYRRAVNQAIAGEGGMAVAVEVNRAVHEGTTVVIHGKPLPVHEDVFKKGRFVLDPEDLRVKFLA